MTPPEGEKVIFIVFQNQIEYKLLNVHKFCVLHLGLLCFLSEIYSCFSVESIVESFAQISTMIQIASRNIRRGDHALYVKTFRRTSKVGAF